MMMSLNEILLFVFFILAIVFIGVYDYRYTEESREYFFTNAGLVSGTGSADNSGIASNDAKINSKYVHDERNEVRQVLFDVDVPLNRYIIISTPTPTPSADGIDMSNVDFANTDFATTDITVNPADLSSA